MFIVPSIFRAIDGYSNPVREMIGTTRAFGEQLHQLGAGSERAFRKATNVFSHTTEQIFQYAESMVAVGAIIGAIVYSSKSMMDYEKELANLKALTGVTGEEFLHFKDIIEETARTSKASTVEVAQTFTTVANAMPQLLESAEGLGQVTAASILLGKAARMELAPAAESVTTILNQFKLGAESAAGLVDMLAAGSKYGSAEINDLSASMKEFGAQAQIAGLKLDESVALAELVSKFRKGAEAGIELRNVLLYMDTLKVQDPKAIGDLHRLGVNMSVVANKALPLADRLTELKKVANDDAALFHIFGKENLTMAATILKNADQFEALRSEMHDVGTATQMAADNTDTLSYALKEAANKWVTIFTTGHAVNGMLNMVKGTIQFVTEHMEGLVAVGGAVLELLLLWKGYNMAMVGSAWLVTKGVAALNFVEGVGTVITGRYATACFASTAGMNGMAAASFFLEAGLMGSLGVIGLAAVALGMLYSRFTDNYNASEAMRMSLDETKNGFKQIRPPITEAQIALEKYNQAMDDYNERQDFLQHLNYEINHRGMFAAASFMVAHPWQTWQASKDMQAGKAVAPPLESDFPGLKMPGVDSMRHGSVQKQVIEHQHVIELKQNGERVGVITIGGGGEPVLGSTFSYRGREGSA
jgi:TP901 family phage tail tape measure protein